MFGFGVYADNAYEVLGLTRSTSMADIKKAYRKLVQKHHPDVSEDTDKEAASARFRQVQTAYEWLSVHHDDQTTQSSDPYFDPFNFMVDEQEILIRIDGVEATLIRPVRWSHWTRARLKLEINQARRLRSFPYDERIDRVTVVDKGSIVIDCYVFSFQDYRQALAQYDRDCQAAIYTGILDQYRQRCTQLTLNGTPTDQLLQLVHDAIGSISAYRWKSSRTIHQIETALERIAAEITRLETGGSQLLVEGLLDGTITHRDVAHNQWVIDQLIALSIRSDGFIEPLTEDQLRSFYQSKVGVTVSVIVLNERDLKLTPSDYAPADILQELDLAPDSVEIAGRKGPVSYQIDYKFANDDGQLIKVGIITIPLSVYERNGYEYGKPSSFPSLPGDIRLVLNITVDGKLIANGFDDDALAKRIVKYKRSKARGQAIAYTSNVSDMLFGLRFEPFRPSQVPPWYKGSRPRW